MKHIKLNQAEIERISEATGRKMLDVIKDAIRASDTARTNKPIDFHSARAKILQSVGRNQVNM